MGNLDKFVINSLGLPGESIKNKIVGMSDKISVLLGEDDFLIRDYLYGELLAYDFKCTPVESIAAARHALDGGFIPEVMLMDWNMPLIQYEEDMEMMKYGPGSSLQLITSVLKQTQGRCRTIIMAAIKRPLDNCDWGGAWGYFYKDGDLGTLVEYMKKGFLSDKEIGQPILDLESEFARMGKERK